MCLLVGVQTQSGGCSAFSLSLGGETFMADSSEAALCSVITSNAFLLPRTCEYFLISSSYFMFVFSFLPPSSFPMPFSLPSFQIQ